MWNISTKVPNDLFLRSEVEKLCLALAIYRNCFALKRMWEFRHIGVRVLVVFFSPTFFQRFNYKFYSLAREVQNSIVLNDSLSAN